jgi:ATP-dependent Lon protease
VRNDVAMTGEISLRGLVLPIGGLKNKVLAAIRAGIDTVMLPARNKKDYEDVPEAARKALKFVWMSTADDAIEAALAPASEADTSDLTDDQRRAASG